MGRRKVEFLFVFYEWCHAVLALILHSKVKDKGTLLLSLGLTTMSVLRTVATMAEHLQVESPVVSRVIPAVALFVPMMTVSGFFLLVRNWDRIRTR
jgi:hypothetical protein